MRPPAACTASASRWSTRCPKSSKSRSRATAPLWRQSYARGGRKRKLENALGPVQNRRGTTFRFKPDPQIFGAGAPSSPPGSTDGRSKAYLFRGVDHPLVLRSQPDQATTPPPRPCCTSPAACAISWPPTSPQAATSARSGPAKPTSPALPTDPPRPGASNGRLAWREEGEGFLHSYCNTVPTAQGGTHEAGLRAALTQGPARLRRLRQQEGANITGRRHHGRPRRHALRLHPRPAVPGPDQGQAHLPRSHALVETALRDHFDHWLAGDPAPGRQPARLRHRARRGAPAPAREQEMVARKSATRRKLRLPGKLADCSAGRRRHRALPGRGRQRRRLRQAGRDRETQAVLPLRGKILNVASATHRQAARQPGAVRTSSGPGLRHRLPISIARRPALRAASSS
jgi:topoisomerase-4 subunit B